MHEESQGSRNQTPNVYQDIHRCSRECKGLPSGVRPSGRTTWEPAVVGPQGSRKARRPPTSPQLTSQHHPGRAAHDPARFTNEKVRAYTGAGGRRFKTKAICSEARKRVEWKAK